MSEQAHEEEEVSNPYNARKAWHKQGPSKPSQNAGESLYYEEGQYELTLDFDIIYIVEF